MSALLLVVEDALEGRGEESLHLLAQLRQRTSRSGRRRDPEGRAEVGEVVIELDVPGLPLNRLCVEVGEDQARVAAVREADALRRENREAVVAVVADELVRLRVAMRHRRLDERSRQEADLASSVGVSVVEGERLGDQAAQPAGPPLNGC